MDPVILKRIFITLEAATSLVRNGFNRQLVLCSSRPNWCTAPIDINEDSFSALFYNPDDRFPCFLLTFSQRHLNACFIVKFVTVACYSYS